jgi:hypothetical protein
MKMKAQTTGTKVPGCSLTGRVNNHAKTKSQLAN